MIDEPGSFSGMRQLAEAAARAGRQPADVVGDLHQRPAASVLSAPLAKTSSSCAASAANLFGRETNGSPVSSAILRRRALGELRVRVQPGADRRAAERQLPQPRQRCLDRARCRGRAGRRTRELLPERQRHGVLQVRAADLDDVANSFAFAPARRAGAHAGISRCLDLLAAAMCMAVGNVSFDDCDMFTSSFGWTGFLLPITPPAISIARFEITSLAFMFVCVPLPVCQTRSGKWSSSLPR
jgi:hypothetical protein